MNKLQLIDFIIVLGLSLTVPVLASDRSRASRDSQAPAPAAQQELSTPAADPGPRPTGFGRALVLNRGSRIIGKAVESRDGTKLGEIFDLLLDTKKGCIAYVALSANSGYVDRNETLRAIPWSALRLHSEKEQYTLDIDAAAWAKAPTFRQHQCPTPITASGLIVWTASMRPNRLRTIKAPDAFRPSSNRSPGESSRETG